MGGNLTHLNAIQVAATCQYLLINLTNDICYSLLNRNQKQQRNFQRAVKIFIIGKQTQWVFMEKEITGLRVMIATNTSNIDLLLGINQS